MGQVEAREAGDIAYMLANGFGKGRARRDDSERPPAQWRLLFLSSGEVSLADKMAEIGRRSKAGQEVRLVDIPADAGAGWGAFEELHGAPSPGAFAEELRQATERYYGAPARRFLELLTARNATDPLGLAELLRASRDEFLGANLPQNASGQVRSVCSRFALVAASGSLATAVGLTGWPDDEADRAVAACLPARRDDGVPQLSRRLRDG
jgi:putative DNA primase/helicase